jgi:sec-independent protein translocase protein TatA
MFGGFGLWEMILVFLVVLLLFGAKRLPEIGSSLGKGIREFKGSLREIEGELKMPEERRDPPKVSEPREEGTPHRLSESNSGGTSPQ